MLQLFYSELTLPQVLVGMQVIETAAWELSAEYQETVPVIRSVIFGKTVAVT